MLAWLGAKKHRHEIFALYYYSARFYVLSEHLQNRHDSTFPTQLPPIGVDCGSPYDRLGSFAEKTHTPTVRELRRGF